MVISAIAALSFSGPALAQQDPDGDDGPGKPVTEITITARRLDAALANIEPGLGASTYALTNDAVESRPGGETTTISQVLLQAPVSRRTDRASSASASRRGRCNIGSTMSSFPMA